MARRRKTPTKAMLEGDQKLTGMKSISPTLDLGNGVTVDAVEEKRTKAYGSLERYNMLLAQADDQLNVFNADEKDYNAMTNKILPAGGLKFGKDSSEYEQLGGVRDSERAKPTRKPKPPTT